MCKKRKDRNQRKTEEMIVIQAQEVDLDREIKRMAKLYGLPLPEHLRPKKGPSKTE